MSSEIYDDDDDDDDLITGLIYAAQYPSHRRRSPTCTASPLRTHTHDDARPFAECLERPGC